MIGEGETAPTFSLPAAVDGGAQEVALEDYRGQVVVLAFYPADFNPACDGETTGLDDLDVFTMAKDVTVLGISGDSVYSHRAFADSYGLDIPLLADVDGEVAAAYGVTAAEPGYPTRRAVIAVGPEGVVRYTWAAEGLTGTVDVGRMREAVDGIGGDATARARYRVGHARYVEGQRAFTSAMGELEERDWVMAQTDFGRAAAEFEEATTQFDTAARFAGDDHSRQYYEEATEKARVLSQAADWLTDAAGAFASGEGAEGEQLRADAKAPLSTARDIDEPVPPDEFPPEPDDPDDPERSGASLDAGFEDGPPATDRDGPAKAPEGKPEPRPDAGAGAGAPDDEPDGADRIDEAELAEITAEVEEQAVSGPEASRDDADAAGDGEVDPADPTDDESTGENAGDGSATPGEAREDGEANGSGGSDSADGDRRTPDSA